MVICIINTIIIWVFVGGFELRQLFKLKSAYFSSFWNYNDIAMLILSITLCVFEIHFTKDATSLLHTEHREMAKTKAKAN